MPLGEVKLSIKQQAFADYYIELGNAYKAAVKAGYSENYAKGNVVKLLENESVKTYIENRLAELASERVADQTEVLEYLTSILRGEQQEQTLRGVGEGAQVIDDIDVSAKDRIKAAELLGKRYKLFTDKVETDNKTRVVIVDDV